jgi:hypothetical protein
MTSDSTTENTPEEDRIKGARSSREPVFANTRLPWSILIGPVKLLVPYKVTIGPKDAAAGFCRRIPPVSVAIGELTE